MWTYHVIFWHTVLNHSEFLGLFEDGRVSIYRIFGIRIIDNSTRLQNWKKMGGKSSKLNTTLYPDLAGWRKKEKYRNPETTEE